MGACAEKTIPNDLKEMETLSAWLGTWMSENSINKSAAYKLQLVVEEIAANAVRYGFPSETSGSVRVRVTVDDDEPLYYLEISDDGTEFNPLEAPPNVDVDAPLDERDEGGLGIFLVQNLSEDIAYARKDGWNCLSVTIRD